jgi:glycolate oxidase FAD binding subunit
MSALTGTLEALSKIVGEANLLTATAAVSAYAVEGQTPLAVALPGTAEEVAALLRAASATKLSVMLRGAGHHTYLGTPPAAIGLMVSLSRLDQVAEYDAEDLTVTAQAGITLRALQETVGRHRQMLPLDPPGPDTATLGGLVSAGVSGAMRMRYGAPRDLVIGMRVALSTGEIIKTGGRTVKNVAGYDIGKLFIGSLGSLGAITEVTTRLIPRPESRAIILASLPPQQASEAAQWAVGGKLEVVSCELIGYGAAKKLGPRLPVTIPQGRSALMVGLAGEAETIARQEREIRERVSGYRRFDDGDAEQIQRWVRGLVYPAPGGLLVRLNVPIAAVAGGMDLISCYDGWGGVARVGDGTVYAAALVSQSLSDTQAKLTALRSYAVGAGGSAVLEAGPLELKQAFPVWGEMANLDLMRQLKQAYDPAGVMGCRRLVP